MQHGRARLRACGAVAAAGALASLWAAAAVNRAVSPAPAALGEVIVRVAPGPLVNLAVSALHDWAKRLLLVAAVAVTVLAGAELLARTAARSGPCAAWRPRPPRAAAAFAGLLAIEHTTHPPSGSRWAASLLAYALAGLLYGRLAATLHGWAAAPAKPADHDRRRFVRQLAGAGVLVAAGIGTSAFATRLTGPPRRPLAYRQPAAPATVPPAPGFPVVPAHTREVTATAEHYVVDINLVKPVVDPAAWRLEIRGLVAYPLRLDLAALTGQHELVEEISTLVCIENQVGGHLIGNSAWGGVRLAEVLTAAGLDREAAAVVLHAADGYTAVLPLAEALHPSTLLAVTQNGHRLSAEHGFPCRLRVPSLYGVKNVKWLTAVEAVRTAPGDFWTRRGWAARPIVKTGSRVDVAGEDLTARVGVSTWIAGVAWSGGRGIARVEVSTDGGGTWAPAQLKPAAAASWRLWAQRWTPRQAGRAAVGCRAVDGAGRPQDAADRTAFPAGATGYHFVDVYVTP